MNLEKRGDYMRSAIGLGSITFLRNVEPHGSVEYNATACFVPLKGYFF